MQQKALFLDRDGVINIEKDYLYQIKDFEFIEGVFTAVKRFKQLNYYIIVITNQSGIGRGYYTENDYYTLTSWMIKQFKQQNASIDDVYFCPHSPNDHCQCRKPKPEMILKAAKKFKLDLSQSWLIGDKESDIIAGKNAGIKKLLLVRSGHKINENETIADHILDSILDVVQLIKY